MRRAACLCLFAVVACAAGDGPPPVPRDTLPARLDLQTVPRGLPARSVPKDNPLTESKVALGRRLFFDPLLSADGTVACASCHDPAHGFAGPAAVSVGVAGHKTPRNAPSLLNRAYGTAFFWDGRDATLESQALKPIANPLEMGTSVEQALERLRAHRDYPARFQEVFPDGLTAENLARALASFERVLLTGNTRVDRFRAGEVAALGPSELHGLWLYESRGQCWRCHSGPNFTDEAYHNTGVGWPNDPGRAAHTKQDADRGRFKTPTLRGLAHTAPYMHDGSLKTLEEVVEFYNKGGGDNPNKEAVLTPLGLSKDEMRDLVAFLKALSE